MDERPPEPQVDARSVRVELGAMTVLLLGGYVFGIIYVIPGLAVVLALALGFGPKGNLFRRLFEGLAGSRFKPAAAMEPAGVVRFSELFGLAVLSVATLFWIVGLGPASAPCTPPPGSRSRRRCATACSASGAGRGQS